MHPIEKCRGTKMTENNCSNWSPSRILSLEQEPCGAQRKNILQKIYTEPMHGIVEPCTCIIST